MNPIHDLTENRLFGAHDASLASLLLRKMTKPSSNRSHQFASASPSQSTTSNRERLSKPDDSDLEYGRYQAYTDANVMRLAEDVGRAGREQMA
jgi:hypothetical protein